MALLVLRHYGYPPLQVHYLGKAATLLLLYAFPGLLLAYGSNPVAGLAEPIAWALTIWGTALYVLAGRSTWCRWRASCRANAWRRRSARRGRRRDELRVGERPLLARCLAPRRRPRRDPRPAYAAGGGSARGPHGRRPVGQRPDARRWRAGVLVALTMAAAGLLAAVTYAHAAATAQGREQVRARLVADIQQESEIDGSPPSSRSPRRGQPNPGARAGGQRGRAGRARRPRGRRTGCRRRPRHRSGLLVTLANADPKADADPVGGTPEEEAGPRAGRLPAARW